MPRSRTRISIGDARSLNWRTHVLFAVPALLSAGFFDLDRLGGGAGSWLLLSVVGLLVTIGVIEGLCAAFKKRRWTKPRAWVVILILAVAGLSRGGTLFVLGGALGVVPESDLAFRLVGGPVFVVSIYLLVDTMVSSFITHQDQAGALNARKEQLQRARTDFEKEIARLTEAQRAQVRELVAPSVWELQKLLSAKTKNVQDAIFEIRSLNETIVRPLSRQMTKALDGNDSQLLTTELATVRKQSNWLPERVSINQSLNLGFFGLLALMLGFSAQSAALGLVRGLALMATTLPVIMLAVWALKWVSRGSMISTSLAAIIAAAYGAVVGYLSGMLTTFLGLTETDQFAIQSSLFVSINLLFTLGLGVASVEREKSLMELEEAVEELALLNSRLRQQVWLARKTLAMELHGSIQSTLQSVAARLSKLKDPTDKELDHALEQVREAFGRVDREDYLSGKTLRQLLDELVLLWEGALDVQINIEQDAEKALGEDQAAARCALEVCREAVTNSVKHGSAEQVKISISHGEGFVQITAINDGINLTNELAGQGINLYREVAHSYSLTDQPEGVTLELQLPLSVRVQP